MDRRGGGSAKGRFEPIDEGERLVERREAENLGYMTLAARNLETIPVDGRATARPENGVQSSRVQGREAIDVEKDPGGTACLSLGKQVLELQARALLERALDSD